MRECCASYTFSQKNAKRTCIPKVKPLELAPEKERATRFSGAIIEQNRSATTSKSRECGAPYMGLEQGTTPKPRPTGTGLLSFLSPSAFFLFLPFPAKTPSRRVRRPRSLSSVARVGRDASGMDGRRKARPSPQPHPEDWRAARDATSSANESRADKDRWEGKKARSAWSARGIRRHELSGRRIVRAGQDGLLFVHSCYFYVRRFDHGYC